MSAKERTLADAIVARADCLHLTGPAQAAENLALVLRLLAYLGGRIEEAARAGGSWRMRPPFQEATGANTVSRPMARSSAPSDSTGTAFSRR